ncbi:MAG: DUF547 domain-containing protein [Deltaproteobacteria bacterium]|nr:DUF547 domain-containing protein [Deltaproteobacteria bacterium]
MYKKISDYGVIGNLRTVALVGPDGSVDWFCTPYMDSPSVFAALLDLQKGGHFFIRPAGAYDAAASYLPRTNVLRTRFRTRTGTAVLTDFMHVPENGGDQGRGPNILFRILSVEQGRMDVLAEFFPRFDYARAQTRLTKVEGGVLARGGGQEIWLSADMDMEIHGDRAVASQSLSRGQSLVFAASCHSLSKDSPGPPDAKDAYQALEQTMAFWENWLSRSETGRTFDFGPYEDMLTRSALVLKLLYYAPSGAMAAAATTSLPEKVDGPRNWDYRYTWIRDTSYTLSALFNLGHLSETEGYLHWLQKVLAEAGAAGMQIVYGLRGEKDLAEEELPHLEGYKGSSPVRVGNAAAGQRQMDIFGELMEAAMALSSYAGRIRPDQWPVLRDVCDFVCAHWREPDAGIWEVRGRPRHFVHSKVLCWTALDRGLTIADRYGFPADTGRWRKTRAAIKKEVLDKGFDPKRGCFVRHYGTTDLDASALLIPLTGFLPFDDPRAASTVDRVWEDLSRDGYLYRYLADDGLEGGEGAFLLCSFWYVDCLVGLGRLEEAEQALRNLEAAKSPLGLFSEEYDPAMAEQVGNFPQAFTHIGYVNAVMHLQAAKKRLRQVRQPKPGPREKLREFVRKKVVASPVLLNAGEPEQRLSPTSVAPFLKELMNRMRGGYFDTLTGRVAYEDMAGSDLYVRFADAAKNLKRFDPGLLKTREQKTAFWMNLYNVMVIHGVIELAIRDSVRETRGFFSRICYDVGGRTYTPDHMEHGILRANRRPPHSLFRVLSRGDPRLEHSLDRVDPRIHFGLVCASSSCPPIDVYTPENLDQELDIAARTFLNSGGLVLDRESRTVRLSRIFFWYGRDFGDSRPERLRALAKYLYGDKDREFILDHADTLKVRFEGYDWRLNRT